MRPRASKTSICLDLHGAIILLEPRLREQSQGAGLRSVSISMLLILSCEMFVLLKWVQEARRKIRVHVCFFYWAFVVPVTWKNLKLTKNERQIYFECWSDMTFIEWARTGLKSCFLVSGSMWTLICHFVIRFSLASGLPKNNTTTAAFALAHIPIKTLRASVLTDFFLTMQL